jgi:hypothetical protein
MITVEFERAYLPQTADPDERYGAWDFNCAEEIEDLIRDLQDRGRDITVQRRPNLPPFIIIHS